MKNTLNSRKGFTLLEAMIAVALLALLALGISTPYYSGLRILNAQADHMVLDSHLRSRMEIMISTDFDALANGSEVITVGGKNYTITWTAVNVDLDGDTVPEPNAKLATVVISELPHRSLTTIVVDHEGRLGKIS